MDGNILTDEGDDEAASDAGSSPHCTGLEVAQVHPFLFLNNLKSIEKT